MISRSIKKNGISVEVFSGGVGRSAEGGEPPAQGFSVSKNMV